MKLILLIILVSLFFTGFAQFKASDGSEFDISPPKHISGYEIYYQSTKAKKPSLYLKVEVLNGLRKKIVEFENGKVKSIQYNFYKDTLLEKAIVQYTNPKSTEIFHYRYDSVTHEQIYAKGYKNSKLIYSYSTKHVEDTIVITEMFNDWWNKSNSKTFITYSSDSLVKTAVEYINNGISPQYSVMYYASDYILKLQIDSSSEHKEYIEYDSKGRVQKRVDSSRYGYRYVFLYTYDSIGKLNKEEIISDTISKRYIDHFYSDTEQVDIGYVIYEDKYKSFTFKTTTKFDNKGNEVYKEEIEYDEGSDPKIVHRTIYKKTHSRNRIVKFEKHNDYGYNDVYWVKYYDTKCQHTTSTFAKAWQTYYFQQ